MRPAGQNRDLPDFSGTGKWRALATVALGTMMATMDASITNIAFPELTAVFTTDITKVVWVTLAFLLVCTSLMLVVGKIGDSMGRKTIYAVGMFVFTAGLLLCSVSDSIGQLIMSRAFQGLGAAMTIACGPAIITESFPAREIGKGLGLLGASVSLGFIAGPIIGGLLLNWVGWRSIFYVRAPVTLLTAFMALLLLPGVARGRGALRLDLKGTFVSSTSLFCLVFAVSQIKEFGLQSPVFLGLIGAAIIGFALFIRIERRAADPVVDLAVFKSYTFTGSIASLFLLFVAAPGYILIMPFYLIQALHMSPAEAGLLMTVNAAVTLVVSPVSGIVSDRIGRAWLATTGAVLMVLAFVCMRGFDLTTGATTIIPVLILMGLGVGTFTTPNNSAIMGSVPKERIGTASALIATLRQVGISVGMACVGTLFSLSRGSHHMSLSEQHGSPNVVGELSITLGFHDVLLFSIGVGLLGVIASGLSGIVRNRRR